MSVPAVDAATLNRAVQDGQLVAWYPSIIDPGTGSAVGARRWRAGHGPGA